MRHVVTLSRIEGVVFRKRVVGLVRQLSTHIVSQAMQNRV